MRTWITALLACAVLLEGGILIVHLHHGAKGQQGCAAESRALPAPGQIQLTESAEAARTAAQWSVVLSLQRDVDALKGELSRLSREPTGAQSEAGTVPATKLETKDETERSRKAAIAKTEETFASEPSDASWSSARVAGIRQLAESNEGIRKALHSIDCRSTTCRVELVDDLSTNLGDNLPIFLSTLATVLPNVAADRVTGPDGVASYVLYLSRS